MCTFEHEDIAYSVLLLIVRVWSLILLLETCITAPRTAEGKQDCGIECGIVLRERAIQAKTTKLPHYGSSKGTRFIP
jgi:hypothetical protein